MRHLKWNDEVLAVIDRALVKRQKRALWSRVLTQLRNPLGQFQARFAKEMAKL